MFRLARQKKTMLEGRFQFWPGVEKNLRESSAARVCSTSLVHGENAVGEEAGRGGYYEGTSLSKANV